MSRITWKSKKILTEAGFVDGYITVEDGYIAEISEECSGSYKDAGELGIYPGIIDVHNHGFGGWSMTDPCKETDVR